jgi:hypothetical protein
MGRHGRGRDREGWGGIGRDRIREEKARQVPVW